MTYYVALGIPCSENDEPIPDVYGIFTSEEEALAVAQRGEDQDSGLRGCFGGYDFHGVFAVESLDVLDPDTAADWDEADEEYGE